MVQAVCEERSEFHVNRIKVEWSGPPLRFH
jgi:hypothetical protein